MAINTKPLSGFRDFGPEEQAQRAWLINLALDVYHSFGYNPIETPALERNEILLGQYGEEGEKLRYTLEEEGGEKGNREVRRTIGLRYDLTVPLARFVAANLDKGVIRLPFRRSQVAPVWRKERAQAGRYREFYQADFDIVGSSDPSADAETVVIAYTLLERLKLNFRLRINHRGLLDGILRATGINSELFGSVMVILDKVDKVGQDGVTQMLSKNLNLSDDEIQRLLSLLDSDPESPTFREQIDADGQAAFDNLQTIIGLVRAAIKQLERVHINFWTVRGLSYYTGIVLETSIVDNERYGSVLSGGRYDGTIGVFLGRQVSAVGASLGVDRCLTLLADLKLLPTEQAKVDIAVLAFPECQAYGFALAARLREQGTSTIIYPGGSKKLGTMLSFAENAARYAAIIGTQEQKSGLLTIKDLAKREQTTMREEEIVSHIRS